jgi:hypothetical protein
VRAYLFFGVSALAAGLTFAALSEPSKPEPSESLMVSSFSQFLSKLETRPVPEIQISAFKKHSCRTSAAAPGYICNFTYSAKMPAARFSVLPARGTVSGTFLFDEDGQLRFEG